MSNKKYKIAKVFDCQDMPDDIKDVFFSTQEAGNDSYVSYSLGNYGEDFKLVDHWLLEHGAEPNDWVLISHWW